MFAFARAGFVAALVTLLSFPLSAPAAAQKAFMRDDLADAAIKLEAPDQGRSRPGHQVRRRAAARGRRRVPAQRFPHRRCRSWARSPWSRPTDSANWLRLARTVLQIRPGNDRERTMLLERAATAAYIAYQRTKLPAEEADSLLIISRTYADRSLWRPALDALRLSLDLREVADVRQQYERMREDHGFRLLDYTVDADAASPRVCFQFSEDLPGRRTDLSPFVVVAGAGQARRCRSEEKQLCVEGLKHGDHYNITLARRHSLGGHETLAKSAEFNVYVRDRKPSVRFSSKAYVLPRTGQRGIPVISVNTKAVALEIYRIGDRNLLNTVLGTDFQRTLDRYDIAPPHRRARRAGLERRDEGRAEHQRRRHHRFPGGRGGQGPAARRLRHGGASPRRAGRGFRQARHAVVHRLRSRPDRVLRQ